VTDAADWAAARQGEDWLLPGGYGNLVQQLADGVPVTTGCVLEALEVGRGRVALATSGGRIEARHVVLTVPLGVLQAERISFSPPLPASVRQALDTLPMGCLMKVGIDLIADPFGETDTYFLHYPASDEAAVLYLMQPGGQAMAYAFVGGSAARALEPLDDAAVREEALAPLRHLLGAATVDRSFGRAVATRWAADPFAFGSYAIARPGGFMARRELAQPLFERIYLVGEATAPDGWMGTVGGAWLAGRAAMAAIDRARGLP
jgi:monoamine oxidase